jgi:DNA modification methylase
MTPYYQDDLVTLYHGDCREIWPGLSADALVTDPPFGIKFDRATWTDEPEQYPALMRWLVAESARVRGWCFVFQGMPNVGKFHEWFPDGWRIYAACKNFAQIRPTGVFHSWDPVVFWCNTPGMKRQPNVVNRDYHVGDVASLLSMRVGHPCPRPVDTMRHVVALAAGFGEIVIDPFAGSGTTLRAAKDQGVRAIGIEIEERYCELAANRCSQGSLAEMFQ